EGPGDRSVARDRPGGGAGLRSPGRPGGGALRRLSTGSPADAGHLGRRRTRRRAGGPRRSGGCSQRSRGSRQPARRLGRAREQRRHLLRPPTDHVVVRGLASRLGADARSQPGGRRQRDVLRGAAPGRGRRRRRRQRVQPRRLPRRAGLPRVRSLESRPERVRAVHGAGARAARHQRRHRRAGLRGHRDGCARAGCTRGGLGQSPVTVRPGRPAGGGRRRRGVAGLAAGPLLQRHDRRRQRCLLPAQL
ncbi:MAG: 3-oxoacyl-[acyl-carrier protein] reductase, partial [uncultured Nocardioidaceae bacterium]